MLVLSRRKGESVIIGDGIKVTVIDVRGDQIRLGIDAPRSVSVHREEIYQQVLEENAAAAKSADIGSPLLRHGAASLKGALPQPPAAE